MLPLDKRLGPMQSRPATTSACETLNSVRLSSSLLYSAVAANDACDKRKAWMLIVSWERMLIDCCEYHGEATIVLVPRSSIFDRVFFSLFLKFEIMKYVESCIQSASEARNLIIRWIFFRQIGAIGSKLVRLDSHRVFTSSHKQRITTIDNLHLLIIFGKTTKHQHEQRNKLFRFSSLQH